MSRKHSKAAWGLAVAGFAVLTLGIIQFLDLFELGGEDIGTVLMTYGGVVIGISSTALITSKPSNLQNPTTCDCMKSPTFNLSGKNSHVTVIFMSR